MEKNVEKKPGEMGPLNNDEQNAALPLEDMKGRFARYNSPFLQLMIPLLTTRYVWLALEDINPLNFLKKPDPSKLPGFTPWTKPTTSGYLSRNFAALGMGATALAVTAFYSKRTYDDIRTLYAEAIGYELDKKPEEVTWQDIFFKSQNAALAVTRDAFVKRTLMRAGASSAFVLPWHALRDWKIGRPKYDANMNAGVGAVGVYLSLDGFFRKQSFFEAEQTLVGTAVNHADLNTHEVIQAKNIQSLLYLQRKHMNKGYPLPAFNSPEGKNDKILGERIADLLNQTYDNASQTEQANFSFGKFNYLVGFGLLDQFPASLGFVELANKSTDMKDVKKAAAAIAGGQDPQAVFHEFGIELNRQVCDEVSPSAPSVRMHEKFVDRVPSPKYRLQQSAKTHQDFAEQGITTHGIIP